MPYLAVLAVAHSAQAIFKGVDPFAIFRTPPFLSLQALVSQAVLAGISFIIFEGGGSFVSF